MALTPSTDTAASRIGSDTVAQERNPVALFFADPNSHLADVLYLYFRDYKRKLIYRFFRQAIAEVEIEAGGTLTIADVGASMGFDIKYVFARMAGEKPAGLNGKWKRTLLSLVEGDDNLIASGKIEWAGFGESVGVMHQYVKCDLSRSVSLPDASQDIVLCSEVVEHLEDPGQLFREVHRILKPHGRFILTTDNSPSALQWLRRIPVWLAGRYKKTYARPDKRTEIASEVVIGDVHAPIYGHINLNPTRYWERLAARSGLIVASFGTYESVRRGGGKKTPGLLALYFGVGFFVSLLPRRVGRFFGDTTALMFKKS